ncbi:hypothetical protein PACILC2_22590 [Paenibacillus cisolokensis]|uniref:Uncharacterized protein n=1 Tax=Paenibacillus cisolokensis TaxID=1658519 RepID=A0ABQ4N709_9BACL|nr:hypothetical protein [Paenibacillus cisolokensis]GIQ63691.1 hypothetical protein PACILC2_22590 [Paenibacillus cisolokensis]
MEIKNLGTVRGGANSYARFFLHIETPDGDKTPRDELKAIFELWDEEFGMTGKPWCGWCYRVNTRREFAVVPAIIRKAVRVGYTVSTSMWDVGPKGLVKMNEDPATFWQIVALAQAYYDQR